MASVWNIGSVAIYIINALMQLKEAHTMIGRDLYNQKGRVTSVLLNSMNLTLTIIIIKITGVTMVSKNT